MEEPGCCRMTEDLTDPVMQIPLSKAKEIDGDYEVGEEVSDEVKFLDFGRRAILSLRQNLTARHSRSGEK